MVHSEAKIQQDCYIWFNNTYCLKHHDQRCLMFSVPNEGLDAKEQSRKKAVGMLPGVSDIILVLPNKVIFCEFKDAKGRQSDKQIDFENRVTALGFEYWIVRNLEDFKNKIAQLK